MCIIEIGNGVGCYPLPTQILNRTMDKDIEEKMNESLRQCGFSSYEEFEEYRDKVILEAEMYLFQENKNIFKKLRNWLYGFFS